MKRLILAAVAALAVLAVVATDSAKAQVLRPAGSPNVTPYLNLLRGGSNAVRGRLTLCARRRR